jgi:hypothetical protein
MQEATRQRLAKNLGIKPSYLAKLVSGIRKIGAETYLRPRRLHGRTKGSRVGPPQVYYELIGSCFVTFPETAYLLLELLVCPRDIPRRINCDELIQRIQVVSSLGEERIWRRIHWAIANGYIEEDGSYLAANERIVLERPYLEMLAGHFRVQPLVQSVLPDRAEEI